MINNGYRIICFEKGTSPVLQEQLKDYNQYSYKELLDEIIPSIRNVDYDWIYSSLCKKMNLLIRDMEQISGSQATIEIFNHILRERVKQNNTTILIGEYIANELFEGISEEVIFCTNRIR